ncbi:uncharacterized protein LOC134272337, partial [Saccostrea cucullata]|uniref:uncharacterized protein LOC134272337 n=1 Tax=Saccostrea cuccullata TaxID=36930 RepID=UPI002ED0ADFA
MRLSASITKIRELNVPCINGIYHMSLDQLGKLWSSDRDGKIIQTDLHGKQIQKIKVTGGQEGNHTITQLGDLIFTDKVGKAINRLAQDKNITHFINTGIWEPYSIYYAHINGEILVGMRKDREDKVTRFNKTGKELHNILRDNKGGELYKSPQFITENINGDICTSDYHMRVVVVNRLRQHRFFCRGQKSVFCPYEICTDVFAHILVCDRLSDTIYLLDQDGQFLSLLFTWQQGVYGPRSVCVDDENNL